MTTNTQKRAACERMREARAHVVDAAAALAMTAQGDDVEPDEEAIAAAVNITIDLINDALRRRGAA